MCIRVNAAWAAVNVVAPPPTPLTNGVPVSGIRDRACWNKYYSLDLPPGQSTLTFTTSGGAGRVDLYVKFGAIPDKATYDCRSYYGGNNKTCTFRNPAAGTWYVMLNAYTAYSGVTLTGTHSLPKGVQAILGVAPVLFD